MTPSRPAPRALDAAADATLTDWMDTYISRPQRDLGRDGAICPYVPAAVRHHLVICLGQGWPPAPTDPRKAIADLILDAVAEFQTRQWPPQHSELRAVVLAIPDMPREYWALVDEAQQSVKGRAVDAGLMIGSFHEDSRVPGAHNPAFHPNTAPIPLVVVRAMARHDLWFLHHRSDWFRAYRRRFARTFHDRAGTDALSELYRATVEHYEAIGSVTTAEGAR